MLLGEGLYHTVQLTMIFGFHFEYYIVVQTFHLKWVVGTPF